MTFLHVDGELRLLVSSGSAAAGFRTLPSAEAASSSGCCASSPSPSPSGESACAMRLNGKQNVADK